MLKTFNEVFDDYTKYGTKIKTEQYHTVGTNIIIDQGQADIAGYTDQIDGLFKDVPVIVFGDHTRIIKYINRPFFLGADGTKILKSKIPNANYKYLYYALKNAKIPNTGYNRHFKWLKQISISFPEHHKQSMIVEILDKLEDSIDNYNTILGLLDKLVKARFIEMFGDGNLPIKTVKELCYCVVDCPHTTPKYEGNLKNPAIRTSEIKKGFLVWDTMRYVSDKEYVERTTRAIPKAGDIVYGREGTFGNAAILPDGYKFCLGQRVMLLRPDYSKCTSEYLLHSVISDEVYRQAIEKNNASTVAHVNVKDVKQFKVPLPSLDKQNEFANFVKQVDKSREAVKKSLEKTQQLYDSLMQEYFG